MASNQMKKAAIAAKALDLGDHRMIFIDGGATNLALAKPELQHAALAH
jgi:DeoR/GlpR family transcriptional regulator of sugar metabolism